MAERIHFTRRRQASKPLLERQRRARINRSLDELKGLVLSALYRDNDQNFQKMEKAEILELTVNFLKMIREQQVSGFWTNQSDPESISSYRAGFNECAARVCSFMENQPRVDTKLREQILVRLAASCSPVKPDNVYSSSSLPVPAVYGVQNMADSPYCCSVSSPPPSPPSSAFSPFNPGNGAVLPREAEKTSSGYEIKAELNRSPVESTRCTSPLWRPWVSNSENGKN